MKTEHKTFTQTVHYCITIEGDYFVNDMWEEELATTPEEFHDSVWEYVMDSPKSYLDANIKLSNLITKEEN